MAKIVAKDVLLAARLEQRQVAVGKLGSVTVRGLTRHEVLDIRKQAGDDPESLDVLTLSTGLVDPSLTVEEVRVWYSNASSTEIEPVSRAILDLSGLLPEGFADMENSFRP